jgi:choline dehydrogenase-like flavoprotein
MWGQPLVDAAKQYRRWVGLLNMSNDDNNATAGLDADGREQFTCNFQPQERQRIQNAFEFSRRVLEAAGATRVLWSGLATTHMQGSCRMGSDASNSVVDLHAESHDVKRLYVGDSSVIPRTLSVNPSLTIMALASRLAEHLHANESSYLSGGAALVA